MMLANSREQVTQTSSLLFCRLELAVKIDIFNLKKEEVIFSSFGLIVSCSLFSNSSLF